MNGYYLELEDGAMTYVPSESILEKIELIVPKNDSVRIYEFTDYDFMADLMETFSKDPKILRKMKKPFKAPSITYLLSILEKRGLVELKNPDKIYTNEFGRYWRFIDVKTPAILIINENYYIIKKDWWGEPKLINENGEEVELRREVFKIVEDRTRLVYKMFSKYCKDYEKLREIMLRTPEVELIEGELALKTGRESTSLADWEAEYQVICGEVEEEVIGEEEGFNGRIYEKKLRAKTPIALVYYREYQFIPDRYGTVRKLYVLIP